jgi:hypothetical protein
MIGHGPLLVPDPFLVLGMQKSPGATCGRHVRRAAVCAIRNRAWYRALSTACDRWVG